MGDDHVFDYGSSWHLRNPGVALALAHVHLWIDKVKARAGDVELLTLRYVIGSSE